MTTALESVADGTVRLARDPRRTYPLEIGLADTGRLCSRCMANATLKLGRFNYCEPHIWRDYSHSVQSAMEIAQEYEG